MKKKAHQTLRSATMLATGLLLTFQVAAQKSFPALILSGQNNHDWQKTTPVLERILLQSGIFTVSVTNHPDTLKYADYKKFRLIVSNWNSWPDTSTRWSEEQERAFTRYMNEGGGALFIHAGGSSFYGWSDYHSVAMGRWGKNTSHGSIGKARVFQDEWEYPFYFGDFEITDEIWENTEIALTAKPLAWVQKIGPDGEPDGHSIPAVFTNRFGNGRSAYTILGHDEKTMANPGFQEMVLKAAGWAAQKETSFSGFFGTLNFRPDRKPHFHPLISPRGTILTAESPKDHLWHMGLWFSWKFIDGLNYWEYTGDPNRHISEGMTDIQVFNSPVTNDASVAFELDNRYHPWDRSDEPVMTEIQRDTVSRQDPDGSYHIKYDLTFTAIKDLLLDRTPIPGEPGGQSWGGYSGMSFRLSNEFQDLRYFTTNNDPVPNGKNAPWVCCEFDNGKGSREQVIISDDPGNPRYPSPWYCINDSMTPMYYFSPAILYKEPMRLNKGDVLHLRYRIYMPAKLLTAKEIDNMLMR